MLGAEASHYFRGGKESLFYGRKRIIVLEAETSHWRKRDVVVGWNKIIDLVLF